MNELESLVLHLTNAIELAKQAGRRVMFEYSIGLYSAIEQRLGRPVFSPLFGTSFSNNNAKQCEIAVIPKESTESKPAHSGLKADQNKWANIAQKAEREWWASDQVKPAGFDAYRDRQFKKWGFEHENFNSSLVIDLGCGPTVMTTYFSYARIVAIDPLIEEYVKHPWNRLNQVFQKYSSPAETFIPELEGKADALFSINALDHAYDFDAAIGNAVKYVKPGGFLFLAFDCHDFASDLHPLALSPEICNEIFKKYGLTTLKYSANSVDGWLDKPAFGDGSAHYWSLQAPQESATEHDNSPGSPKPSPDEHRELKALFDQYTSKSDFGNAVELCLGVLSKYPDDLFFRDKLADIYAILGAFESAAFHYKKAIKLCPDLEIKMKLQNLPLETIGD